MLIEALIVIWMRQDWNVPLIEMRATVNTCI